MKKVLYIFVIFIAGLLMTACEEEFLETTPTDQTSSLDVVATTDNAYAALNGIYRLFYFRYDTDRVSGSQGRVGITSTYIQVDCLGEDVVQTAYGNGWFINMYRWLDHRNESDSDLRYPWRRHYRIIANANTLINGVQDANGPQDDKDIIQGEALALRAFSFYQIVQLYGERYSSGGGNTQLGVPLLLNDDSEVYEGLSRATVEEVYAQVNSDLDQAILLLDGQSRVNKTHINVDVARALKARVALTMGEYATAITYAQEARVGYPLMDSTTYSTGFDLTDQSEFMWWTEISEDQTDRWGNFGAFLSRNMSSSNIRGNPKAINSLLYNQISNSDVRKQFWDPTGEHLNLPPGVSLLSSHARFPYTNQKFIAVSNSDSRVNFPHVRSAEMYLIEAEAQARLGNDVLAQTVLTEFALTRDAYYTATNTGQALIDEIMIQRRIELWGEGFRWYDLKRLNLPLDRTGANHDASVCGNLFQVPAGDVRWQWLIPEDEMNDNPNMVQNPL